MASLATLPVELIQLIIQDTNLRDKYILIRVCRHLRLVIEPMLYERIQTHNFEPHTIRHIFRTLANRPDLAKAVDCSELDDRFRLSLE